MQVGARISYSQALIYDEDEHYKLAIEASKQEQEIKISRKLIESFRNQIKREGELQSDLKTKSIQMHAENQGLEIIYLPKEVLTGICSFLYGDLKGITCMLRTSKFFQHFIQKNKLQNFILIEDSNAVKINMLQNKSLKLDNIVFVFNEKTKSTFVETLSSCADRPSINLEVEFKCDSIRAHEFFALLEKNKSIFKRFKCVKIKFKNICAQNFLTDFETCMRASLFKQCGLDFLEVS